MKSAIPVGTTWTIVRVLAAGGLWAACGGSASTDEVSSMKGDAGPGAAKSALDGAPGAVAPPDRGQTSATAGADAMRGGGDAGQVDSSTEPEPASDSGIGVTSAALDAAARRDGEAKPGDPGTSDSGFSDAPSSDAGLSDSGAPCKRGIGSNTPPGAAFSRGVGWWYNWSLSEAGGKSGIEFDPMVWGAGSLGAAIPAGSKFLLGFNEPNFHAQSNLTAAQAAADWGALQATARAAGARLVSPAVNFCGPAASCNGVDPYQYLKDFFAACPGCEVDGIAVHWYNCDLPSLRDYLEPGGSLQGFEQFGKPIWLTEFSCDGTASAAQQEAYMRAAIPYLESNPHVYRYAWFSAGPIPNAQLVNADGTPTPLGQTYMGLPGACP